MLTKVDKNQYHLRVSDHKINSVFPVHLEGQQENSLL